MPQSGFYGGQRGSNIRTDHDRVAEAEAIGLRVHRMPQRLTRIHAENTQIPAIVHRCYDVAAVRVAIAEKRTTWFVGKCQIGAPTRRPVVGAPGHMAARRIPKMAAANGLQIPAVVCQAPEHRRHLPVETSPDRCDVLVVDRRVQMIGIEYNGVREACILRDAVDVATARQSILQCRCRHRRSGGVGRFGLRSRIHNCGPLRRNTACCNIADVSVRTLRYVKKGNVAVQLKYEDLRTPIVERIVRITW